MKRLAISLVVAGAILVSMSPIAIADDMPALSTLKNKYATGKAKIDNSAFVAYTNGICVLMNQFKNKGDLDAFLLLQNEQKASSAMPIFPVGSVRDNLSSKVPSYSAMMSKLDFDRSEQFIKLQKQYIFRLDVLMKELMTADKIEEARAVKEERDAIVLIPRPQVVKGGDADDAMVVQKEVDHTRDSDGGEAPTAKAEPNSRKVTKIVLYQTYNSPDNNCGTKAGTITIFNGDKQVLKREFTIAWRPPKTTKEDVELKQPVFATRVRINCTRPALRGGEVGLAEVEIYDAAGKNIAPDAELSTSSQHDENHGVRNLVDGMRDSAHNLSDHANWVPGRGKYLGWVEFGW